MFFLPHVESAAVVAAATVVIAASGTAALRRAATVAAGVVTALSRTATGVAITVFEVIQGGLDGNEGLQALHHLSSWGFLRQNQGLGT